MRRPRILQTRQQGVYDAFSALRIQREVGVPPSCEASVRKMLNTINRSEDSRLVEMVGDGRSRRLRRHNPATWDIYLKR